MQDYKILQIVNNKTLKFDDDISTMNYIVEQDVDKIIKYSTNYFNQELNYLSYPAKSYAVAIIYSHLIFVNFKVDFFESLNDENLFCGNDKYFLPYFKSKFIYDRILSNINFGPDLNLDVKINQVLKTIYYFNQEFGIQNGIN